MLHSLLHTPPTKQKKWRDVASSEQSQYSYCTYMVYPLLYSSHEFQYSNGLTIAPPHIPFLQTWNDFPCSKQLSMCFMFPVGKKKNGTSGLAKSVLHFRMKSKPHKVWLVEWSPSFLWRKDVQDAI